MDNADQLMISYELYCVWHIVMDILVPELCQHPPVIPLISVICHLTIAAAATMIARWLLSIDGHGWLEL